MLQLKEITKVYGTADGGVHALRGVNLAFRKSEFVSILGQSGCGKTTLLNVIGGLDQYTSGDLVINNRSTKEFRDADWDSYRNHSVGFVFQNYNLIPHQTVLANVELALTLSGVSREERRHRAAEALSRVGLSDQIHKKPNQMSGGQMQRVAIARALVNNPDILLADEPTGALDSQTSVQIMEILKEISRDKLVIMVTHNPELAEQYSTRIIRLLDGRVTGDTNPYTPEAPKGEDGRVAAPLSRAEQKKRRDPKTRRTSMSFLTALSLSFNNLMTKKARTFLTSFAGSIGIIGIALILSVSQGVNAYINSVQEETLSSYPITLQAETTDMSGLMLTLMGAAGDATNHEKDAVYANVVMYKLLEAYMNADTQKNNLRDFITYMDAHPEQFANHVSAIQYLYDIPFDVFTVDGDGKPIKVDAAEVFEAVLGDTSSSSIMSTTSSMMSSASAMDIWEELIPGGVGEDGKRAPVSPALKEQYRLVSGAWPTAYNEVVLIVNENQELPDMVLYALGLKDRDELPGIMAAIMSQDQMVEVNSESWPYEYFTESLPLSLVLPIDYYEETTADGAAKRLWSKIEDVNRVAANGLSLKISGIIAPAEGSNASTLSGSLGYTYQLTEYMMRTVAESELVQYQRLAENENYDALTGLHFVIDESNAKTDEQKRADFLSHVANLSPEQKYELLVAIRTTIPEAELKEAVDAQMLEFTTNGSLESPEWDRAEMEEYLRNLLAQAGAGVNSDFYTAYIEGLSDTQLATYLRAAVEEGKKVEYRITESAKLEAELTAITDAEVTAYKAEKLAGIELAVAQQTAAMPDGAAKEAAKATIRHQMKLYALFEGYELMTDLSQPEYGIYLSNCTDERIAQLYDRLLVLQVEEQFRYKRSEKILSDHLSDTETDLVLYYDTHMPSDTSPSTLQDNLTALGLADVNSPDSIVIYVATFADKEFVTQGIADYNATVTDAEDEIHYTDYVALLMSSITTIINAISYVLIAFVAISLVVSSIMIGIITYISVLERTKEIGILRAIGASKGDISRVFNAETLTVGFVSGGLGIGITLLFNVIINIILYSLTGLANLRAFLPWEAALVLVAISMGLTLIAGLLPSRIAAKKDPVVALRTE